MTIPQTAKCQMVPPSKGHRDGVIRFFSKSGQFNKEWFYGIKTKDGFSLKRVNLPTGILVDRVSDFKQGYAIVKCTDPVFGKFEQPLDFITGEPAVDKQYQGGLELLPFGAANILSGINKDDNITGTLTFGINRNQIVLGTENSFKTHSAGRPGKFLVTKEKKNNSMVNGNYPRIKSKVIENFDYENNVIEKIEGLDIYSVAEPGENQNEGWCYLKGIGDFEGLLQTKVNGIHNFDTHKSLIINSYGENGKNFFKTPFLSQKSKNSFISSIGIFAYTEKYGKITKIGIFNSNCEEILTFDVTDKLDSFSYENIKINGDFALVEYEGKILLLRGDGFKKDISNDIEIIKKNNGEINLGDIEYADDELLIISVSKDIENKHLVKNLIYSKNFEFSGEMNSLAAKLGDFKKGTELLIANGGISSIGRSGITIIENKRSKTNSEFFSGKIIKLKNIGDMLKNIDLLDESNGIIGKIDSKTYVNPLVKIAKHDINKVFMDKSYDLWTGDVDSFLLNGQEIEEITENSIKVNGTHFKKNLLKF